MLKIYETEVSLIYKAGYLGAGKTTLVNHVLREQHGKKIAVVLNGLYTLSGAMKQDRSLIVFHRIW